MSSYTFTVDGDLAEKIGADRQACHEGHSTPRFYDDKNTEDVIGIKGELAFAEFSGLQPDLDIKPEGDNGVDFNFKVGSRCLTIDVKTARKPYNLLLKESEAKRCADIIVLAGIKENTVWFIGWEHKSLMLLMNRKTFGYKIMNYYRAASQLRTMDQLKNLINYEVKK